MNLCLKLLDLECPRDGSQMRVGFAQMTPSREQSVCDLETHSVCFALHSQKKPNVRVNLWAMCESRSLGYLLQHRSKNVLIKVFRVKWLHSDRER